LGFVLIDMFKEDQKLLKGRATFHKLRCGDVIKNWTCDFFMNNMFKYLGYNTKKRYGSVVSDTTFIASFENGDDAVNLPFGRKTAIINSVWQ